ncbi:MAG: glutamyl-tRNA reductase [Agarilytica sp.]
MTLIALGINHNTATVEVREKLAFGPSQLEPALREVAGREGVGEIAILSTCNRTEIYCHVDLEPDAVLCWLAQHKDVALGDLRDVHYLHLNEDAARHMMKVASGLDSMVLGEPQILGQMKSSYATARESGTLGGTLHTTFQQVFSVAKRVRSETAIGENPVSVAYAAVSLAQQIFSDLKKDTALLIGAGETIELVARHLMDAGIKQIIVANRTLENALLLADKFSAEAILLADMPEYLHRADIVISSTASQLPILGKGSVESALKKRKHKPMFMVDIAVPRDIEAEVSDLGDVFLYTVDDLKEVIDENKRSREEAAEIAHEIVEEGVKHFLNEQRSVSAVNTIKQFRAKMDALKEIELAKSISALEKGASPEEVLAMLARNLTNKMLHTPTSALKQAGIDGRDDIVRCLRDTFDLEEDEVSMLDEADPSDSDAKR